MWRCKPAILRSRSRLPRIPSTIRYTAIVGLILLGCAGLIVPVIGRVREAANRLTCTCHSGPSTVRGIEPGEQPFVGIDRPIGGFHVTKSLFSRTGHMALVVMCDGTSRLIADTISPEVLAALAIANGQETLPADW